MKKTFLLFCLLLRLVCISQGQTVLKGIVTDNNDTGISNVYIILSAKGSSLIQEYASSNADGSYSIIYKGNADTVCVSVSRLDYGKQSVCVPNTSQQLDFRLKTEVTQLREVIVKPTKVWRNRDTVNYSVNAFSGKNDRTIADVLRKLPGIEVSTSGRISYNGEPINRFYVENMDLMGGQYNIVSNNLSNKHVETVQVYENHEPVKALQESSMTDKAAINLVLKDDAKAKWLASGKLGLGLSPLLWDNELTLMRFAKTTQGSYLYKNNNAGNNISADLTAHYGAFSSMQKNDMVGIPSPTPSLYDTKWYLFNNAHLFNANQLWKLNKDYQLQFNADFLNDYQIQNNNNQTIFFLPNDSSVIVHEKSHVAININRAKAAVTLTGNHSKYYLQNSSRAQTDWSSATGNFNGDMQYLKNPYYNLSNDFIWFKVLEKIRIEIHSNNRINNSPQSLTMHPGLYSEIFNNNQPYDELKQTSDLKDFLSDNYLTLSKVKGRWSQNYTVGYKLIWQDLDSRLGLPDRTDNRFSNRLTFAQSQYYVRLQYNYIYRKVQFEVDSPLGYWTLHANDKQNNSHNKKEQFYFNPSLTLRYDLSVLWNVAFRANYNESYNDINSLHRGYIMNNYRSIMKYDGDFSKTETQSYSLKISYRDPIQLANAYFTLGYSRLHLDKLYEQEFDGILSIRKGLIYGNNAEFKSVNGTISKGFDNYIQKIQLQAGYSMSASNQLQQGVPSLFKRNTFLSNLSVESNLTTWLNCNYVVNFSTSKSNLKGDNVNTNFGAINRLENSFKLNVFPVKHLQLGINMDYQTSSAEARLPNVFFMDFNMKYKLKKFEFTLNWNNIFDERDYVVAYYGDFYSMLNVYELRPTNLILTIRFSL